MNWKSIAISAVTIVLVLVMLKRVKIKGESIFDKL